ncbi:MAG: exodeoxyribonuclease VII small subunit [Synergistaceae bacterium]|jgi:exodeoxyribonuclease VII small subunit|nr:exodeoxyribonuclease VII small subunit [Synergistaceae bacterium]
MSFSNDMERLQEIVNWFESENPGIDESLELFEEGIKLIKNCREYLEDAKRRVTILTSDQGAESGLADG